MTRAHAAMLPDGRRLHLQDGPIDLVIEAFGTSEAVRAAYAAAVRRFDGLLDELCAELPVLRAPVRTASPVPAGMVALRMHAAVTPFAMAPFVMAPAGAMAPEGSVDRDVAAPPFSRLREKVPEGRMRARRDAARVTPGRPPAPGGRRPSSGAARHLLPQAGEGKDATVVLDGRLQAEAFITPMAAVAGSVADEVLSAMVAMAPLARAYVNNGGDIALHLAPGERFAIGLVDRPDRPSLETALFARTVLAAEDGIGGIATSGWRGRSFSLGIADAVTVLATSAAAADAAATIIANAVDLPGHPAIVRVPATDLAPDSDLGARPVTRDVGPLTPDEIDTALARGVAVAEVLHRRGLVAGAALHLAGETRTAGRPIAASAALPIVETA